MRRRFTTNPVLSKMTNSLASWINGYIFIRTSLNGTSLNMTLLALVASAITWCKNYSMQSYLSYRYTIKTKGQAPV